MNLKLAPKGEGAEEGLELAGEKEASSGNAEYVKGSQRLRSWDIELPQHRSVHRMPDMLLFSSVILCAYMCA